MSPRVSRAKNVKQTPGHQTTLLGSIPLPSSSSIHGNLTWSALGQALVVTDDVLFVLSPLIGLHPKLATPSRLCDVETHPDWQGCFPHASCQIHIKTLLEQDSTVRLRHAFEADYSDSHPLFANARWKSASWSRPGMGPNGSCLILAVTSEMDLYVIGAPSNSWTGDWQLLHSVDLAELSSAIASNEHHNQSHTESPISNPNHDKLAFSPSRNDIRKQQKATEVLCASWVDLIPQTFGQSPDANEVVTTDVSFAWIVAGVRAGFAVVLKCQAVSGHCALSSSVPLSKWSIDRLVTTSSEKSSQLAFQCADGIFLCPLTVEKDRCAIQSTVRLSIAETKTLSNWKWLQHRLVVVTVGSVFVYDSQTTTNTTYYLGTASDFESDPYSAAVSIHQNDQADGCIVVLQDMHEYLVPFQSPSRSPSQSAPTLVPAALSPIKGYSPLLGPVQRRYDALQKYHASEPERCSSSYPGFTHLVGAILMDERAAAFGFNVSETSRYQLLLKQRHDQNMTSLLSDTLRIVVAGIEHQQPPIAALGAVMSYFHTCADATETAKFLAQNIRDADVLPFMEKQPFSVSKPPSAHLLAQEQALYVLTLWLRRQPKAGSAGEDLRPENHRLRVDASSLSRWLPSLTKLYSQKPSEADRCILLRLSAAVHLLPPLDLTRDLKEDQKAALAAIGGSAQAWSVASSEESRGINTQEKCAACLSTLSLAWSKDSHSFEHAICKNSHLWPRCSVTLAAISDHKVRTCTTCWVKSLVPGAEGQSTSERKMLEAASRCSYCGSCWILS